MKILHIHPSLAGGGIESMICSLSNEMTKYNNEVSVCSIFKPKPTDVFWKKMSDSIIKLSLGKEKEGFSFVEVYKIYKLIKKGGYDVVNLHGFFYYYFFSVLLLHSKVKFVYTVHSDAVKENSKWDKRLFFLKKECFKRRWVHVVTISTVSQKSFYSLYQSESKMIFNGVKKETITVNNILCAYKNTDRTKIFIHVGRIDTPKNQLVLCKVFNRLILEGHDVALLIAGAKQNVNIFSSIKPYLGERIHYLGERNDIPELMANSYGMCLPSIWEGLPVTLLEALSVGCIPICSPVGGIVDVVHSGENGFLSFSCSEDDYYDTMVKFLSLSDLEISKIKSNCVSSFSVFDINNTVLNYLNFYSSI